MAAANPVAGRRPRGLDDAPENLTLVQAAHALGMSKENVRRLEAEDPDFPKRIAVPFGRATKFRRHELVAWQHRPTPTPATEVGA